MANRILSAGDIIDAYCTSCRTIMNHTIVSMISARPARVQCNTCRGVHNYRPEKTVKKVSATKPSRPSGLTAANSDKAGRQEWMALQQAFDLTRAVPYHMQSSFKAGTLMSHPSFGLGVVKRIAANKVEVLFEEGLKLLRCA